MDLYDEFGNYIGPDIDDDDDDDDAPLVDDDDDVEEEDDDAGMGGAGGGLLEGDAEMGDADGDDTRVVLHEDKKYYPTALEVYGEEVEATVQEEDTQPITQPIVAPVKPKNFDLVEKKIPTTRYSTEFLTSLMGHPELVRNIAVIGALHHGKTLFVDNLVHQTHIFEVAQSRERLGATIVKETRYTDSRVDEQKRGLSIKAAPMTLLLQSSSEKRVLVRRMDAPPPRSEG